ncbi:MAG: nucleotide kinase domain-containing protein [Dysgonomonas sp.]
MIEIKEEAFKYYFHFMQKRMDVFWKRYEGHVYPWTDDTILKAHKFTNVYRSSDRVSQYLIKNVIYNNAEKYTEEDILLRILIFKVFNKIETWEYLIKNTGEIAINNFNINIISKLLTDRIAQKPIFNSAYLMTGSHQDFLQFPSKHERWLVMIEREFIKKRGFNKIIKSKSLEEIFNILSECPFIGDFLAYQYAIDFNYSDVINFDENSFVKAGIGAVRGIKKCFLKTNGYSNEDLIRYTQDHLDVYREKYGYANFKNLFGREPTLIDLQNCFCETDKYLRVKMPELNIGNTRIKQKYKKHTADMSYFFPPKWNINENIEDKCIQKNTMVLTLS